MKGVKDEGLYKTIHDFLELYLPKMRKCSPNTIRSYRKTISSLLDFVAEKENVSLGEITFSMIGSAAVTAFLDSVETSGASVVTRNQRLQAIRSFFTYAAMIDPAYVFYKNEVSKVPAKKNASQTVVDYLSEAAVKALFEQPDVSTEKGLRDLFLLLIMYDSAARVQEIVDIRLCDLTAGKTPTVVLHGKGSKTRIVPLMPSTMKHYDLYLNTFHPDAKSESDEFLFYSERNGVINKLDTSTVRKMIQKYGEKARETCPAVPKKMHPHLLRHSRAMHLDQHGMEISLITQGRGHAQYETTLIYAYADTEHKRKAIEQATPSNSILKTRKSVKRFVITDDDMIRRLYGLA